VPLSQTDFRPGKRPRYVPSGSPRRKFPLIRLLLLLGLGVFIYTKFDTLWASVRSVVDPVAVWQSLTGGEAPESRSGSALVWSDDSSRVTLTCKSGLTRECCAQLNHADGDLCGATTALLEKARWKAVLTPGKKTDHPLHIEARAVVSDLGDWGFELSGVRGRDGSGTFTFRRSAGSHAWCEIHRGCLKAPLARAPLTDGRLVSAGGAEAVYGGTTVVRWVSASSRVRAMLPGRITAVLNNTAPAGDAPSRDTAAPASVTIKVYHGGELYATYGPLRPAQGVKAGVLVKSGSYLGDAMAASGSLRVPQELDAASPDQPLEGADLNTSATLTEALTPVTGSGYTLTVGLRQSGQPVDPATFWGLSLETFAGRAP
jgi:hypothetical protein